MLMFVLYIYIYIIVGCKHQASEGVFCIGGREFVCQIIEPVMFVRCVFIFALRNIALDIHVETFRTFMARRTDGLKYIHVYIYNIYI